MNNSFMLKSCVISSMAMTTLTLGGIDVAHAQNRNAGEGLLSTQSEPSRQYDRGQVDNGYEYERGRVDKRHESDKNLRDEGQGSDRYDKNGDLSKKGAGMGGHGNDSSSGP